MNKSVKESKRYSVKSLKLVDMITRQPSEDPKGLLFATNNKLVNLSNVKILHFGTDTIRQLYKGIPQPLFLEKLDHCIDSDCTFSFVGHPFSVSKMGKLSGYRYKLQNNALGLVILVGMYYANLDTVATHLKIEVSPHLILKRRSDTTNFLHRFASQILQKGWKPSAVALHLACDFQGWEPDKHFVDNFITRSKNIKAYMGVSDCSFNLSEVATVYGKAESFTFGKADALQVTLYRKDLEADKRDKLDFWRGVWGDLYKPGLPVYRLEVRFHHTVLNDISNGMGVKNLTTSFRWYKYLPEIWKYALNNNRLESSYHHLAPIWQLLRDDATDTLKSNSAFVPVVREKKTSSSSVARNIANLLGNMVSLYARQRHSIEDLWDYVQSLHVWPLLYDHYQSKGLALLDIRDKLESAMLDRYLIGKAA